MRLRFTTHRPSGATGIDPDNDYEDVRT